MYTDTCNKKLKDYMASLNDILVIGLTGLIIVKVLINI